MGDADGKYFVLRTKNIFVSNITRMVVSQKYFKPLFHLIRFSTKVIEFVHINFSASISSEDGVWEEFIEIDSNSMFSKKWVLQKLKSFLPFFFSHYVKIMWLLGCFYMQRFPGFEENLAKNVL